LKEEAKFKRGDKVVDGDGFKGFITKVTHWEGSVWYDVRFPGGEAVRYNDDLTLYLLGSGKK
jgi:hypothetical protein